MSSISRRNSSPRLASSRTTRPVLEPQPHARELAAVVGGVEAEADVAAGVPLVRAGEHLAVGEVLVAVGVHPGAAGRRRR